MENRTIFLVLAALSGLVITVLLKNMDSLPRFQAATDSHTATKQGTLACHVRFPYPDDFGELIAQRQDSAKKTENVPRILNQHTCIEINSGLEAKEKLALAKQLQESCSSLLDKAAAFGINTVSHTENCPSSDELHIVALCKTKQDHTYVYDTLRENSYEKILCQERQGKWLQFD